MRINQASVGVESALVLQSAFIILIDSHRPRLLLVTVIALLLLVVRYRLVLLIVRHLLLHGVHGISVIHEARILLLLLLVNTETNWPLIHVLLL